MSGIHPETAPRAVPRHTADAMATEIRAMNRAFLELLTDPLAPDGTRVLGLDAAWVQGLRRLSSTDRDELAAAPLLLADFRPRTNLRVRESDDDVNVDGDAAPVWKSRVDAFANRLLAALWHFSRLESGLATFCLGLDPGTTVLLRNMSFAELSVKAPGWCAGLRARHADHPTCWPDLIRLVSYGHSEQLNAARLGMIPLTVARQQAAGAESLAR
ncbi:MAG: hypothetical protein HKN56_03275 [Gammaproteobacteria bacterium]|nr:hypothetical protein [Gammaproteobacteria bacterium]NND53977.1 hypothetical protein [Gammaproteobacteria bacterium]